MLPTKDFEFSTLLCSIQQRKQVSKLFKSFPFFKKPLGVIRLLSILTKYITRRTLTIRRCKIKEGRKIQRDSQIHKSKTN